jgi:uncharacterized membrane protein
VKKYLIAGLLAWLPLAITVWVLSWLIGTMDALFLWLLHAAQTVLPAELNPSIEALRRIPGLSIVVLVALLLLSGVFVTNIFGQWLVRWWDAVVHRIPIVKSIYSSVKQVSDTLFSSNGNAFREAVLVQYPRKDAWTVAFVTGKPGGEVAQHLEGDWVSVYVPTTPNPTSGFFLMMPRSDLVELDMSVDQALKYVISMGVVVPPHGNVAALRNQTG